MKYIIQCQYNKGKGTAEFDNGCGSVEYYNGEPFGNTEHREDAYRFFTMTEVAQYLCSTMNVFKDARGFVAIYAYDAETDTMTEV